MPIVTSFVPSLPANAPFKVSIQSWYLPQITENSQTIKNLGTAESCEIPFEARLFVDGGLAFTRLCKGDGEWPQIFNRGGKSAFNAQKSR